MVPALLIPCRLDVRESAAPQVLLSALQGTAVDVLINNAGVMGAPGQVAGTVDYGAWLDLLAVNVIAPHRFATALLRCIPVGSKRSWAAQVPSCQSRTVRAGSLLSSTG